MAAIPITQTLKTGVIFDPTTTTISLSGDTFVNNGNTILLFFNNGGGPIVPTIVSTKTLQGLSVQDPSLSIGSGEYALMGPYPAADFNDASGLTSITYAGGVADVMVTAISA